MKFVGVFLLSLIGIVALGWLLGYVYNYQSAFFMPRYEQVRRSTFENAQAYVEGQRRDMQNLRLEWMQAEGGRKLAVRALALERIYGLPPAVASDPDIKSFRHELEQGE